MDKSGTRSEMVDLLREMAEGWYHLCKDRLSAQAAEAVVALESGSDSVQVGHTTYSVAEVRDVAHADR